jgi:hypothetical protein
MNALKPMHIDDTAYYYYARQLARHPLDPYGFRIYWYETPQSANDVLAPPVLPYWCSIGLRLFGNNNPVLWKLWLFPFSAVLVLSICWLTREWSPGWERELTVMTVLSPSFLPSLNLMLDVPALALSLFALVTFIIANVRGSMTLALVSGLIAGLGMQTKYTAVTGVGAMLLYSLLLGQTRYSIVAIAGGLLSFASWESFLLVKYGESHFLHHLGETGLMLADKLALILPLANIMGTLAPGLGVIVLAALHAPRYMRFAMGAGILAGYAALICFPEKYFAFPLRWGGLSGTVQLQKLAFGILGSTTWIAIVWTAWRLLRPPVGMVRPEESASNRSIDRFLVLWLALEIAGYFALSPFPAARRVLAIVVVTTLVVGRALFRFCRPEQSRALVRVVAAVTAFAGVAYYALDFREAYVQKQAAAQAAGIARIQRGQTVWFTGHWGFQYYAEQAGMKAAEPERSPLRQGDWLIVPDSHIYQQEIQIDPESMQLMRTLRFEDPIPLRTITCYYAGDMPLRHIGGPRLEIKIYRIK